MKNIIEQKRKERGMTQQQLAAALGVSRQTIISLENGKYNPSILLARTAYVANKARSMTFFICVYVQLAAALLAILVFNQPLVGQVLCGLTCLQSLLYTVFYWHYNNVY